MLDFLKDHPFAVEAYFDHSIVLTFAAPKDNLQRMIPDCFTLDTLNNKWAFIAVAMVETRALRPKGFPSFTGNDFFLTGYRIFVRHTNNIGKNLRGLYILKSETDKMLMSWLGNIFTHYKYELVDINCKADNGIFSITGTEFNVQVDSTQPNTPLPQSSPFASWKEARRYAGPLPFTFSYDSKKKEILTVQGMRENWVPEPVVVNHYKIPFLEQLNIDDMVLANAFIIRNIPYYWKKGTKELWKKV